MIGIDRFGESAPANELFEHFGFSTGNVVTVAQRSAGLSQPQKNIQEKTMTIKVGINGYGRIGRNVLRALYEGDLGF